MTEDAAVTIDPNTAAVTTQALVHSGKRKHIFKFVKTVWGKLRFLCEKIFSSDADISSQSNSLSF